MDQAALGSSTGVAGLRVSGAARFSMPISWGDDNGLAIRCPVCGQALALQAALCGVRRQQQAVGVQTTGCGAWFDTWWSDWSWRRNHQPWRPPRNRPGLARSQVYAQRENLLFGRAWDGGDLHEGYFPSVGASGALPAISE